MYTRLDTVFLSIRKLSYSQYSASHWRPTQKIKKCGTNTWIQTVKISSYITLILQNALVSFIAGDNTTPRLNSKRARRRGAKDGKTVTWIAMDRSDRPLPGWWVSKKDSRATIFYSRVENGQIDYSLYRGFTIVTTRTTAKPKQRWMTVFESCVESVEMLEYLDHPFIQA